MECWIFSFWLGLGGCVWAFEWVGEGFEWLAVGKTNVAQRIVEPEATWEALERRGETLELPDQLFEAGKAYASLYRKGSVQQQIDVLVQRVARGEGDRLNLLLQLGSLQVRNRLFDVAARTFLGACLEFPDVETPVERLAFCLLSLGDHAGGYGLYGALAMREDVGAGVRMNFGSACYNVGKPEEAARQFEGYMGVRAADWKGAYNLGAALFSVADFEGAEEQFRRAHELAPSRPYGLLGQAWVREVLQDVEGFEALKRELERRMGRSDAAQLLGRPRLPVFLADTPVFPLVMLGGALEGRVREVWVKHLLVGVGRAGHALSKERLLRECLEVDPAHGESLRALFGIYVERKEAVLGGMVALTGMRREPEDVFWEGEWRSFVEHMAGEDELNDGSLIGEEDRGRVHAHFADAARLSAKGRYREAEIELRKILSRYPRWPRGLLELGRVYVGWKRLEWALSLYALGNALYPDVAEFSVNYGSLLFSQGFPERAMGHLEALRVRNPGDAGVVRLLLEMYLESGRAEKICAESRVLSREFKSNVDVLLVLRRACEEAGDVVGRKRVEALLP